MIGRKQSAVNSLFVDYMKSQDFIPLSDIDNLIDKAGSRLKGVDRVGLAWSGGKDSVVVEHVLKSCGYELPSCLGITDQLEYPAFMRFVTEYMPDGLNVFNSGHGYDFLKSNPEMLFPQGSKQASIWFKNVQHSAQNRFCKKYGINNLVTGRRVSDGNYTGKNGVYTNSSTSITRHSIIYDWRHEEVMSCIIHYNLPLAPCYKWRNGFVVGTGNWAARQWTGSIANGWRDIYEIDKNIVIEAAKHLKSASEYVRNLGL